MVITMKKRMLGNNLEVSAVGLGTMGFTHAYGAAMKDKEAARIIEESLDYGYTFFDTAEFIKGFMYCRLRHSCVASPPVL
jgi:aryl-alcohol dehydrogenase-like predicted oxidoreductase